MDEADVEKAVARIREGIAAADREAWPFLEGISSEPAKASAEVVAESLLRGASLSTMTLCERLGLPKALSRIEALLAKAPGREILKSAMGPEDPYLVYSHELSLELSAIADAWGVDDGGVVSRELIEILRGCEYSITDVKAFGRLPESEEDVHQRVEAVLRCVFRDLRHKPSLSKPLKNFEPDTGIPSLRTLIEYKFVKSSSAVATISDQVLADTRGYSSPDWDRFIYVIYETERFQPEEKWRDHLRQSGVSNRSTVVVLSGTPVVSST